MGLFNFFKKSGNTSIVRQLCEIMRPPIGENYSDSTATSKYRSWVYVASTFNANNVADAEVKLFTNKIPKVAQGRTVTKQMLKDIRSYGIKAMKDTQEIEDHPILDLLNAPNAEDTAYSFFQKVDLFLELTGDAYILIERAENGLPIALFVLFSQYVTIQTDGSNQVINYNYGVAHNGKFQYQYPPEDIIHIKFFDPNSVNYGISPLEASARSFGLIQSMDTYEEALNRNLGIPSGILRYKNQQIKESDRQVIEKKWQQKFASVGRQGKIVVTDQDVEYDVIGVTPRDMQMLDGRKWSREEILACYGVNPALLLTEDVNRSNMVTASINYFHNTLKPRLKLISQTLTNELIKKNGIDGSDLFVMLSKDAPQDDDLILQKHELLTKASAITVNELRHTFGMELLEDNIGNTLINISSGIGDTNEE